MDRVAFSISILSWRATFERTLRGPYFARNLRRTSHNMTKCGSRAIRIDRNLDPPAAGVRLFRDQVLRPTDFMKAPYLLVGSFPGRGKGVAGTHPVNNQTCTFRSQYIETS
jgi:hypothetical protein